MKQGKPCADRVQGRFSRTHAPVFARSVAFRLPARVFTVSTPTDWAKENYQAYCPQQMQRKVDRRLTRTQLKFERMFYI